MITGKEATWILTSYLLGCFTAGYYWVRWRTGEDIRRLGSGNVGARNVGRRLGAAAFAATLLVDAAKGALAVGGALHFNFKDVALIGTAVAVVAGHIWPFQLRFQGGKGVAVSLGVLLAYSEFALLMLGLLTLPFWALLRSFTLAGLAAFALAPMALFFCDRSHTEVVAMSALALVALIAHRRNIREEIARYFPGRPLKDSPNPPEEGTGP
ncbi:MAG TPA: glycerol-3-phosphate acyltransferase [Methylomirabilota bacterium]|nr:glycerol-3-phosphate acyltransferase [Methylomirabilota bacterium]